MHSDTDRDGQIWKWMRVYYFESCKDPLLLNAVWPTARTFLESSTINRFYFMRDWKGGPNLLLGVGATEDDSGLLPALALPIQRYLDVCPSLSLLTCSAFERQLRAVGLREGRQYDASCPLMQNNHIELECAPPASPLMVEGPLKELVRSYLCASSSIVVEWLTYIYSGGISKQELATRALTAIAWVGDPDRLRTHLSFYSHADGFLRGFDAKHAVRAAAETKYKQVSGKILRALVAATLEDLRSSTSSIPGFNRFTQLIQDTLTDLLHGMCNGTYRIASMHEVEQILLSSSAPDGPLPSFAPESLAVAHRIWELMETSPVLRAWQVMINLVYLTLNQLGISPLERLSACYFLSRTVHDMYGDSPQQLAEALLTSGDTSYVFTFDRFLDETVQWPKLTTEGEC